MSKPGVFTGFDFENTWEIDPNSTYKYPQLKGNRQQRVEGISIESLPNKLDYTQGEDINTDGGSIKITYEGGYDTTVLLTKDMLSGYNMSIVGTQTVKVNYGGKTAEFEIKTGEIAVTSVSITGINTIPKGTQMKLSVSVAPENATDNSVKWSSSDESKATVDADGNVTALATGEVTITATASNGVSAAHKLAITAPCVLLMLDESSVTLYKGDTKEIGTKLSPIDTTDKVVWSSSNSNIASVGDSGVITAVSPGETTITAKAGNGKAVCQVTVKQNLSSFYIVGVADKTYTGNSIEQDIKVTDGNVTLNKDEDYTVSYSNNINVGTAEITISGLGYYEGSIKKAFNFFISVLIFYINRHTPSVPARKCETAHQSDFSYPRDNIHPLYNTPEESRIVLHSGSVPAPNGSLLENTLHKVPASPAHDNHLIQLLQFQAQPHILPPFDLPRKVCCRSALRFHQVPLQSSGSLPVPCYYCGMDGH